MAILIARMRQSWKEERRQRHWKGRYPIEGAAFIYADNPSGRVTAILGYPTAQLAQIG